MSPRTKEPFLAYFRRVGAEAAGARPIRRMPLVCAPSWERPGWGRACSDVRLSAGASSSMGKEIERKFLVTGDRWRKRASRGKTIRQAYLTLSKTISLRVRMMGKRKAYLTVQGARAGISRAEFEYEIPFKDARALMKLRVGRVIKKRRYVTQVGKHRFEIDEFEGDQAGLIIAEVELATEKARFDRPDWLGKEVTKDRRYHNGNLAQRRKPRA